MGTILKYIFYLALILVVYLVGKDLYQGKINNNTTVGQVKTDIKQGSQQLIEEAATKLDDKNEMSETAKENQDIKIK